MSRVLRVLLALLLTVVLAEGLARVVCHVPPVQDRLMGRYGPDASELEWLLRRSALSTPGPRRLVWDGTLGWRPAPGETREQGQVITVSAGGDRVPAVPEERTPGVARWLALGDSFVFGSEASDGTLWVDRVRAASPGVEVVNHGVFGYGVDQVWLAWDTRSRRWKPDVVLVGVVDADFQRTLLPFMVFDKPVIPAETGSMAPLGLPLPTEDATWWRLVTTPRLVQLWRMGRVTPPDMSLATRRGGAILDHLITDVRATGAVVVLVWLPPPWNDVALRQDEPSPPTDPVRTWFLDRCAQDDVRCVDTQAGFRAAVRAGVSIRRGAHWTEEGHAIVADAVLPVMQSLAVQP